MKQLVVQVQPDRAQQLDREKLCQELEDYAASSPHIREHTIESADDSGRYINLTLCCDDLKLLWSELRTRFFASDRSPLASVAIVTCEGTSGWDDYLLLHHYDGSEELDSI